ncbi:hypothetical protein [Streptomyces violascens]|uniref:hypothetical protein n=1 Tax=Streptomyces violascens TaxID=67381 RepID=UPI00369C6DC1
MIILDTSAVRALADGHKALSLLAGNMANTPGDRLNVPALCLMQAEAEDARPPGVVTVDIDSPGMLGFH